MEQKHILTQFLQLLFQRNDSALRRKLKNHKGEKMSHSGFLLLICIGVLAQDSKAADKVPCPNVVKGVKGLNTTAMQGIWYEQHAGGCTGTKYTLLKDGSVEIYLWKADPTTKKAKYVMTGNLKLTKTEGTVTVAFPNREAKQITIVEANYGSYMVDYTCTNQASDVFIKTRDQKESTITNALAALRKDYPQLVAAAFVDKNQATCPPPPQ